MRDLPTIAIVDDDESVRDTTKDLLDSAQLSIGLKGGVNEVEVLFTTLLLWP